MEESFFTCDGAVMEKSFSTYDEAVEWMNHALDIMTDINPEGDFLIEFRYVNLGWQVAVWDETDE